MNATLGDPYLLATYDIPSISKKGKGKEVAPDERRLVFVGHSSVPKRDDGQVTLAVQGDGIHIFELGDLHPVSSRTLGPSTSFASAPVTVICSEGEQSERRTYVTMQSAQDLKKEDAGRVIWSWREQVSGDVGSSQDRQSTKLPHDISYLVAPQNLNTVIAVSNSGSFTRLDLDLNIENTWSPRDESQRLIKLFNFPRQDCRFIPGGTSLNSLVMVVFAELSGKLLLQIIVFGPAAEMDVFDPLDLPSGGTGRIVDVSCEPSGGVSVLGSNGLWTPYTLSVGDGSANISPGSAPLKLRSLTIANKDNPSGQVSLLGLGSSFVLLAGTTSKEIALLLWDIQYGVLLNSATLPIPTSLENSANGLSVHLSKGSTSQALMVLSPIAATPKRNSQLRSSVWLVPFSVPVRSTIALAMGKAAQSAPWLAQNVSQSTSGDVDLHGREAMLKDLQEAIEKKRTKTADDIFFNWLAVHEGKGQNEDPPYAAGSDTDDDHQDVKFVEREAPKAQDTKSRDLRSTLGHTFVVRILSTILQPEGRRKHCSPKIYRYLLTKHLVSHSMVAGGLLRVLMQSNDWETIRECFTYVVDLPENELIRLLHVVVRHHRIQSAADRMVVDKPKKKNHWNDIPSVNSFLAHVVDYPSSPAAWRVALREYFADVEDLVTLLLVSEEWLRIFTEKGLPITLGEITTNEHGVHVPVQGKAKRPSKVPLLENLLTFLQAVLDSSFLSLLQMPASHPLLQSIAASVNLVQAENIDLESLRGPLDPFARSQRKSLADAASGGKKREESDWRKRRKQAHEQAAVNLGPYQVEELMF